MIPSPGILFGLALGFPLLGAAVCLLPLRPRQMLGITIAAVTAGSLAVLAIGLQVFRVGPLFAFSRYLFVDKLSLYHLALVCALFLVSSVYSVSYFGFDEKVMSNTVRMRRFCVLWLGFLSVLQLVLFSNHMGLLWIAIEGTTLLSAFLILTDGQRSSIEAMWKYLMICSVGILLAFVGTLLLLVATRTAGLSTTLLWTDLLQDAGRFHPRIMMLAFLFALVGFGTKAGLAPLHTWLPDAHSQAPTPVSAVFSGVMINCALYAILRYLPLTEAATGRSGDAHSLLLLLGLLSIGVAAIFIPAQTDVKRFLAYCSVEHMGIIAVGVGLGGFGVAAALFHTLNHSLSKTLAFFSAGRIAQLHGVRDMRSIRRAVSASPLWGSAFLISILALIGAAPFAVFMSEFQILKAAADTGRFAVMLIFLAGAGVVFISALRHAMNVSWRSDSGPAQTPGDSGSNRSLVVLFIALLVVLGLVLPGPYAAWLAEMAAIVENTR